MGGRFLRTELGNPYANLALEEAIHAAGEGPSLRAWEDQTAVVVGRAQLAQEETDTKYCRDHSIPIVRRFTGGGTVYHGPGNLNWSFFARKATRHPRISYERDPAAVFRSFAAVVLEALESLVSGCRFDPPNRIVSREGKVSGMAAYVSESSVLCHGTLLLSADLRLADMLTKPTAKSLEARYPRSSYARIANLGLKRADVEKSLVEASKADPTPADLTKAESRLASRLEAEKYRQDGWNLGDPFSSDYA
ncbi:MAG TPA: biotin/lipoate A/B protein ligase family protein [Nitrososphaerales archaeon]|nr:biotin/lipoate A/B protein ligase family protein [Nitrososphaerales archaeon]